MHETLVRRIWLAGGWPPATLRAVDGTPLQVIYPGRPGPGYGPDLRDAIVALPDGRLVRGDVELHVRSSDWQRHGHQRDQRYTDVVLHVVWRDDRGRPVERVAPEGDRATPPLLTVALVAVDETHLFERLRSPTVRDEPYHDWLRTMRPDEVGGLLDRLGDERLQARAARLGADLHALGADQALHLALLDALGYSQNRTPFRRLGEIVTAEALGAAAWSDVAADRAEGNTLALLFAAAGLLDAASIARLPDEGRVVAEAYAQTVDPTVLPDRLAAGEWQRIGVRPANQPARRLGALARLAVRTRRRPLADALADALAAHADALGDISGASASEAAGLSGAHTDARAATPGAQSDAHTATPGVYANVRAATSGARGAVFDAQSDARAATPGVYPDTRAATPGVYPDARAETIGTRASAAAARALLGLVLIGGPTGGPADYWAYHHAFGRRLVGAPVGLLGDERARAILANVLLPGALALADARGDDRLAAAALSAWRAAPAAGPNWIVAEMRPVVGPGVLRGARREQGAIELYQRCCAERRCRTCPLASAAATARR